MQKNFLKIFSPKETINSDYYKIIVDSKEKLKGPPAYLLDWSFIFEQIDIWKKNHRGFATILDVGCANSMFHPFLEKHYKHGIIGIDRLAAAKYKKLEKLGHTMVNAVDICCDFIKEGNNYFNNNVDIVFWNSAIEHNSVENIKEAVNVSLNALRKGGIFISTWAFGTHTHWNEKASATILSEIDAKRIFRSNWKIKPDFEKISNEYKENVFLLKEWHLKRFGNLVIDYVHAGNILVKK